jgi:hypothetical protein
MPRPCKCGCAEEVPSSRRYVNKRHQIEHMLAGEAKRLNRKQPVAGKQKGGKVAGTQAAASGRLAVAGLKGASRAREIADEIRQRRSA